MSPSPDCKKNMGTCFGYAAAHHSRGVCNFIDYTLGRSGDGTTYGIAANRREKI